jgi:hypothetical protein
MKALRVVRHVSYLYPNSLHTFVSKAGATVAAAASFGKVGGGNDKIYASFFSYPNKKKSSGTESGE